MKKILITGAKGFIGAHLGNRLSQLGYEVVGIDNLSHYSECPITFKYEVVPFQQFIAEHDLHEYHAIFHLAAHINVDESILAPDEYFRNNAMGTLDFLKRLHSCGYKGKFIFASSAEVYGSAQKPLMDEDHPLDPLSPYAVAKLAAEQMCKLYAQLFGLNITVIRNFNTFGEYQNGGVYGGVIAKFKNQALAKKPITVYGSGEQMRDYMHISQAVAGYVLALQQNLPTIVNFGSGTPIKIIDIANYIAKKFDGEVVHTTPRPGEVMRLEADITRAKHYGYKVETDFWKHLEGYLNS